ncbi:Multidrug resistance protein stp [Mycobacterium marinum]|nr:Multidrug resistance protein stp [Mycobacterium marinum]
MSGVSISSFEKVTSRHSKRPGATPARTHLAGHARKGFANLTHRRQPSSAAVLLVAAFGAFLAFLDSTIVNIAFPDIQKSFPSYDLGSLSWILNAYNIVFAAFLVAAGRMADLLGRRRTFTFGVVIFTIASGLCAVAGSGEWLVAFRLLQGIGAAVLVPASLALVVEGFEPARRAHAVGLWGGGRGHRVRFGPAHRRHAGRLGKLAMGVSGQHSPGRRRGAGTQSGAGRKPRRGAPAQTRPAWCDAAGRGAGAAYPGTGQGPGLGLGERAHPGRVRGQRDHPGRLRAEFDGRAGAAGRAGVSAQPAVRGGQRAHAGRRGRLLLLRT